MMTLAPDVRSWVLFPDKKGQHTYAVGSVEIDKYVVVPAAQYPVVAQIIEKIPTRTPEQITEELKAQGIATDVGAFCRLLSSKGLLKIDGEAAEAPAPKTPWYDLRSHLKKLAWQLPALQLTPLQHVVARVAGVYRIAIIAGAVLTTLGIFWMGDFNWVPERQAVREMLSHIRFWWILLINSFMVPFFIFFHEAGHASFAAWCGIYPRKLSVRMFLVMPYFSLHLPGLTTLPLRQRLLAIIAGPVVDFTMGNAMFLLAHAASPSLKLWFLFAAFANWGRGIYNVVPFLPIADGYVFMSQALFREMDIRARAGHQFRRWRRGETRQFALKYAGFYLLNFSVVISFLSSLICEVNRMVYTFAAARAPWAALQPMWVWLIALAVLDAVGCYLIRDKLKMFFAW